MLICNMDSHNHRAGLSQLTVNLSSLDSKDWSRTIYPVWKATLTFPQKLQVRPARLSLVALTEQTRFKMSAILLVICDVSMKFFSIALNLGSYLMKCFPCTSCLFVFLVIHVTGLTLLGIYTFSNLGFCSVAQEFTDIWSCEDICLEILESFNSLLYLRAAFHIKSYQVPRNTILW